MARVLVIGPGALGVLIAVRLQDAGHSVHVAVRSAQAAKGMPGTWRAVSEVGTMVEAAIDTVWSPKGQGPYDALILATKADDALPALKAWWPCLAEDGAVIALQNGILGDRLAPIAKDQLVECTVSLPATLIAPGHSEQTGPGGFILGAWPDGRLEPATPIDLAGSIMADAGPTHIHQNMLGVKWTKLCINSAITGLGVVTGRNLGDLLESKEARNAFLHIITEGYRAGTAQGVQFEKVLGFHPKYFHVAKPRRPALAAKHALLGLVGRRYRRQRSSSLQSLERGRKTEVHHLNGRIADESERMDLEAPVNEAVVKIVAQIEAGKAEPSMAHLAELPFRFH